MYIQLKTNSTVRNNKQATQRKKPLAAKDEQEKLIKEKFTEEEEVKELLKEGFMVKCRLIFISVLFI